MSNQYSDMPSLTGQKFGKWTVGKEITNALGQRHYQCTCECGKKRKIAYNKLTSGKTSQCTSCKNLRPICKKGHDISIYGRSSTGVCRACAKEASLFYKYGITIEEYEALYKLQKGKCAICSKELSLIKGQDEFNLKGRTEVDHKHVPKKQKPQPTKKSTVRGLLCGGRWAGCNAKLGHVDKIEWLRSAANYLENPPAQQLFKERLDD